MNRRFKTAALALPLLLVSCGSPETPQQEGGSSTDTGLPSSSDAKGAWVANLTRPQIDGEQLTVTTLDVARIVRNGVTLGQVYVYSKGDIDYVELTTSFVGNINEPLESTAEEKLTTTRHTLKPFPTGKVIVGARACVAPERAIVAGKNCGAERLVTFLSDNRDSEQMALQAKIHLKELELVELSSMSAAALKRFIALQSKCETDLQGKERIETLRRLIENFLATGTVNVQEFFKPLDFNVPQFSSQMQLLTMLPFAELVEPLTKIAAKFESMGSKLDALTKALPLFKPPANPILGMSQLGGAIFDLFTADKQIIGKCLADDIAKSEMGILTAKIQEATKELQELKTQLKSEGEAQ